MAEHLARGAHCVRVAVAAQYRKQLITIEVDAHDPPPAGRLEFRRKLVVETVAVAASSAAVTRSTDRVAAFSKRAAGGTARSSS